MPGGHSAQNLIPADAHWAAVILSAPVQPDDLMAVAASYDQTGHYGVQTPFSDQLAARWEEEECGKRTACMIRYP